MSIGIFRRLYAIRRRGAQQIINGYATSDYTDFTVNLNVQPLSTKELLALPEGSRTVKRVKSFGSDALISADEHGQTPGDCLFYNGEWYECITCVHWLHTPLSHYEAQFVILADQSSHPPPNQEALPNDN
jgi:hypothetical protein